MTPRVRFGLATAGSLIVLVALGMLWFRQRMPPYACRECNVLLISIDTLRADHMGCYGYARNTTPNIDTFRRDAVLFQTTIAQASSTSFSHGSMFTSLIPQHHGASWTTKSPLKPYVRTMPQILTAHGYVSVSYNGGGLIAAPFGFDRGFAIYDSQGDAKFSARVDAGIAWLRDNMVQKFFLFLHSYEVHVPYDPEDRFVRLFEDAYAGELPRTISPDLVKAINRGERRFDGHDLQHIVNVYDGGIRSMDEGFGKLDRFLHDSGLYDQTLIILTGDHGEELGEREKVAWHSHSLYDEVLRAPLIVKFPRSWQAGAVVEAQVSHVDILPTVLDVLGIPADSAFVGQSLGRLVTPDRAAVDDDARIVISQRDDGKEPLTAVRTPHWKLLTRRSFDVNLLYDLQSDPLETHDVAPEHPAVVAAYQQAFSRVLATRAVGVLDYTAGLNEGTREQLRALGYGEEP
jgi:arylsulfatase A-like enzyme